MIDSGRGLIDRTPFSGPVLPPIAFRKRLKQPGLNKGKRKKLDDRDWSAPTGVRSDVLRFWLARQQSQIARLRGQPGFPTHSRMGVPDGMRKAEAQKLWQEARLKAVNTIMILVKKGQL